MLVFNYCVGFSVFGLIGFNLQVTVPEGIFLAQWLTKTSDTLIEQVCKFNQGV